MTVLSGRGKQLRRDCLIEGRKVGYYHFGGAFSCVEILMALYDKKTLDDDIIVSKGHGWFPQYLILKERGFSPKPYTHPMRDPSNGVTCTTGSLGHGLPMAAGIAWGKKLRGEKGTVYCVIGEGDVMEGTFWETLHLTQEKDLNNLMVIWDHNGIQGAGRPFARSEEAVPATADLMNWAVDICDGHDYAALIGKLEKKPYHPFFPLLLVAHTIKGRGVSFMENNPDWHANWPSDEQLAQALEELG